MMCLKLKRNRKKRIDFSFFLRFKDVFKFLCRRRENSLKGEKELEMPLNCEFFILSIFPFSHTTTSFILDGKKLCHYIAIFMAVLILLAVANGPF
jgi:hypothetical protein